MRTLVTGATGTIGRPLVSALLARGVEVLAQSRQAQPDSGHPLLRWCRAELDDVSVMRPLLEECQSVIHLASSTPVGSQRSFASATHQTRCLCEAARGLGLRHIVVASSAGVYGGRDGPVDESTPVAPDTPYRVAKWRSEQICRRAAENDSLPVSLVRLTQVFGPGTRGWQAAINAFGSPRYRHIGAGRNAFHPIHIDDAVSGLLSVLDAPAQHRMPYLLAAPRAITSGEAVLHFRAALGLGPPSRRPLPEQPFRLVNQMASRLYRVTGIEWRFPQRYELFVKSLEYRFEQTSRILGYRPRYSVAEAIAAMMETEPRPTSD